VIIHELEDAEHKKIDILQVVSGTSNSYVQAHGFRRTW
jgi:hypothetical protein